MPATDARPVATRGLATGGLPSEQELDRAHAEGFARVELALRWDQHALLAAARQAADACRERAMEPVVVLHVGGPESWVGLDAPDRFRGWAADAGEALSQCSSWLPILRPNDAAVRHHLSGRRCSIPDLLRSLDHQLAAHVFAADVLRERVPGVEVALSLALHPVYELDGLLGDVLAAPMAGVPRAEVGGFLVRRRRQHAAAQGSLPPRRRLHQRVARSVIPLEQALPRTVAAAYGAAGPPFDRIRRDRVPVLPPPCGAPLEIDGAAGHAGADVVWEAR